MFLAKKRKKKLHSRAAVLAPHAKVLPNRSATYTFSLLHTVSKLSLWCPSWDSAEGSCDSFFISGLVEQSSPRGQSGVAALRDTTGKSSGGSPCQLHFPGESRRRYMRTWTHEHHPSSPSRPSRSRPRSQGRAYCVALVPWLLIEKTETKRADWAVALFSVTCELSGSCWWQAEAIRREGEEEEKKRAIIPQAAGKSASPWQHLASSSLSAAPDLIQPSLVAAPHVGNNLESKRRNTWKWFGNDSTDTQAGVFSGTWTQTENPNRRRSLRRSEVKRIRLPASCRSQTASETVHWKSALWKPSVGVSGDISAQSDVGMGEKCGGGGLSAAQKAKEPFFDAAHSQTAAVRGAFYKLITTKHVFV